MLWADSAACLRQAQVSCCSLLESPQYGLEAWVRDCQWVRRAEVAMAVELPQHPYSGLGVRALRQACRGTACRAPKADRHSLSRREAEQQPLERVHSWLGWEGSYGRRGESGLSGAAGRLAAPLKGRHSKRGNGRPHARPLEQELRCLQAQG